MAGDSGGKGDTYSASFAFIYVFNLIIGVGALSLPKAFSEAGLVLGTLILFILAFMSFMTSTFMIEAMATANAYAKFLKEGRDQPSPDYSTISPATSVIQKGDLSSSAVDETTPLIAPVVDSELDVLKAPSGPSTSGFVLPPDDYEINTKYEMGTMANMFYHPIGIILYYVCICLYLYGDLAIYAVAIPKSLATAVCADTFVNFTDILNVSDAVNGTIVRDICFSHITFDQAYYIFLSLTVVVLCPWTYFNLTKSKYIQLGTTIMRNVAFLLMICIAIAQLAMGTHAEPLPPPATLQGFPVLFGVSIYSFMCQHSLPGMITPMRSKKRVLPLLAADFSLILLFYVLLTYTGAFRFSFDTLNDLYTLNFFRPFVASEAVGQKVLVVLGYFLALFPVFTLSTNFPIISITLRENLKALARTMLHPWIGDKPYPWVIDRLLFPTLALVLPILIAFATQNVVVLVSVTGSFPGIGVQYVIPATLAFAGRRAITKKMNMRYENKHKSPFRHITFFVIVLAWTAVSFALILTDDIIKLVKGTFLTE